MIFLYIYLVLVLINTIVFLHICSKYLELLGMGKFSIRILSSLIPSFFTSREDFLMFIVFIAIPFGFLITIVTFKIFKKQTMMEELIK